MLYKTKDGVDRVLPGIGITVGGQIETDAVIENPMFELVTEPVQPPAPAPLPAPIQEQPNETTASKEAA